MTESHPHSAATPHDRDVVITRTFDAPRELVFAAWSWREHLERWYAPSGCSIEFRSLEFRSGGKFHSCIRTPDGHHCWCIGEYREVVPPERIVFTMRVADEQGHDADPVAMGMDPTWPRETVVTITLAARGEQTLLTLHQTVSEALAKRTGAHPSWLSMFDNLAAELATRATA